MFLKICEYIYQNVKGFLTSGKKTVPPQNEFESAVSKGVALACLLIGVGVGGYFTFQGVGRFQAKGLLLVGQSLTAGAYFWKGVSINWMLRGLAKYWIFPALILAFYWIAGLVVINLFNGERIEVEMFKVGFIILSSGLVGSISSFMHVRFLSKKDPPPHAKILQYIAFGFYGCVWLVAVGGGLVMIFFEQIDKIMN